MINKPLFGLVLLLLGASVTWGHEGASGIVKERMEAMKQIGKSMKVIGQMIKGVDAHDPALIRDAALTIKAHSGEALTDLFPEGSLRKPSEAIEEIWLQWDDFFEQSVLLGQHSEQLSEAANDLPAAKSAFLQLAEDCKSCHEKFRLKKE